MECKESFDNERGGKCDDLGVKEVHCNVFKNFCNINKKVYDLILDNDSSMNFVSGKLVEHFKLSTKIRQDF
jgi:hypothetical protein